VLLPRDQSETAIRTETSLILCFDTTTGIFGIQCHLTHVTTTGSNGHNHSGMSTIVPLHPLAVALRVVLEIP